MKLLCITLILFNLSYAWKGHANCVFARSILNNLRYSGVMQKGLYNILCVNYTPGTSQRQQKLTKQVNETVTQN